MLRYVLKHLHLIMLPAQWVCDEVSDEELAAVPFSASRVDGFDKFHAAHEWRVGGSKVRGVAVCVWTEQLWPPTPSMVFEMVG